ncbi:MAG: hypothetical protein PQJ50_08995 [Spirochaetales bacterium]|nr:hypothetical protein [Spirochaetales bacterium]
MIKLIPKYLLFIFILTGSAVPLTARTGGNLYRIMTDASGAPVRLVFVRALRELDPEEFLVERLNFDSPEVVQNRKSTIIYDRRRTGEIPVLCFHRIGEEDRYELTLNRIHHLMAVMSSRGFYPLSDREFGAGDLSSVPSGMIPFVAGADDAGATQLLWDDATMAAYAGGGRPGYFELDPDCLASVFTRYFPKSGNRYNFTFYMSFDAIPFRQISGSNPGFPYEGISVVRDKIRYAQREFFLGHHSLTHTFREEMAAEEFFREVSETNRIVGDYLGYPVTLPTLAFPYGSGTFTPAEKEKYIAAVEEGRFPETAFDLDGRFSPPPWSEDFVRWNISRFSVENRTFDYLLSRLDSPLLYQSRRVFLIHSPDKNLNLDDYELVTGGDDIVYVYIP